MASAGWEGVDGGQVGGGIQCYYAADVKFQVCTRISKNTFMRGTVSYFYTSNIYLLYPSCPFQTINRYLTGRGRGNNREALICGKTIQECEHDT